VKHKSADWVQRPNYPSLNLSFEILTCFRSKMTCFITVNMLNWHGPVALNELYISEKVSK